MTCLNQRTEQTCNPLQSYTGARGIAGRYPSPKPTNAQMIMTSVGRDGAPWPWRPRGRALDEGEQLQHPRCVRVEGSQPENGVAGDFMLNIISGDTSHVKPIGPTLNAAAQQPVTSLIGHKHVMKHVAFVTFRLRRCFNHHCIGKPLQSQSSTNSTFIFVRFLKLSKMMMHPTVWNWHNTFQLSTQQQLWANEAILGLNQQKKQKCHHRKKQKCHQQKKVTNKKTPQW